MAKSIEDIDRQIEALKEQRKRQVAAEAEKKREGLRSCKVALGGEVVNLFESWTQIDPELFSLFVAEHSDEIVSFCSTHETDLNDAVKRTKEFSKAHSKKRRKKAQKAEITEISEEPVEPVESQAEPQNDYSFMPDSSF